jgi:hypothetical protein
MRPYKINNNVLMIILFASVNSYSMQRDVWLLFLLDTLFSPLVKFHNMLGTFGASHTKKCVSL